MALIKTHYLTVIYIYLLENNCKLLGSLVLGTEFNIISVKQAYRKTKASYGTINKKDQNRVYMWSLGHSRGNFDSGH